MSTATVHPRAWRLTLSALLITIIAGTALLAALALGLANPPRAGPLVWQSVTDDNWIQYLSLAEADLYLSPSRLPAPPFTLEVSASNDGGPESAWGIWLEADNGITWMLVTNESYLSISVDNDPHWREFFHIRPIANQLYLHIEANNKATFRVNDEIAWTGMLISRDAWGVVLYRNPDLQWDSISMYAPNP